MYDRFFKLHPDSMWIYDLATLRFLDVNEAAILTYGYARDEFAEMTIKDIRPQEDVAELLEHLSQRRDGIERSGVWRHQTKAGTILYVDIRSSQIVHEGHAARLVAARDVTSQILLEQQNRSLLEREQAARKAAEETADLLRIAGKAARLGGWAVNLAEGRARWSDVTAAIHQEPPGTQPTVDQAIDYYVPEHRDRIRAAFQRCTKDGTPFDETLRIVTQEEKKVWVRAIGEAVRAPDGTITGAQGAFQDISELVQARQESRRLEQRLRETLDSIGEGFFVVDRDWRFTFVNQVASRLVQQDVQEMIGKSLFDVFPEARGSLFEAKYREAIATNAPVSFVEYFPPLSAWFEVNAAPSSDRLAIYFRDVTETRAQQERLLLLQMAVSRLNDIVLTPRLSRSTSPVHALST